MQESSLAQPSSPEFGYRLHSPRRPTEPGFAGLDVYLRTQPTLEHFDPDFIRLRVASADGGTEILNLSHPWLGPLQWRACAGQVDLLDRRGKQVDLYCFGGELQIARVDDQCTHVTLKSGAPILHAQSQHISAALLIQETEILLAEVRADFSSENIDFDNCLTCLDSFELYRMCVTAIIAHIERLPYHDESAGRLRTILQSELAVIGLPVKNLFDIKG